MTKQIELTQGKFALVDDDDFKVISKYKWHVAAGYAQRTYGICGIRKNIYMHTEIMKTPKGYEVDHINNEKLDNRKSNLRICTHANNQKNQTLSSKNKSGYRGVDYYSGLKKWRATITIEGNVLFLGYFKTAEEAARKYDEFSILHHGEYGKLNFEDSINTIKNKI